MSVISGCRGHQQTKVKSLWRAQLMLPHRYHFIIDLEITLSDSPLISAALFSSVEIDAEITTQTQ